MLLVVGVWSCSREAKKDEGVSPPLAPGMAAGRETAGKPQEKPPQMELASDEGMWTFDNFPSEALKKRHGFAPDAAWLDAVRMASVRLAGGCSGSLVSPHGLVMTNHHCVHRCVQELSTARQNYIANGFMAVRPEEELRCPGMEVNRLMAITDVTDRIAAAAAGKTPKEAAEAMKAERARIEKECAVSDAVRCDVVTLYQGGRHHLYRYERHSDVRLVFAPELDVAFFGGNPDNFMFPRYDLDAAFLRIYKNGKPAGLAPWFSWSTEGIRENDLVFVSGHPGRTSRQNTMAQLVFDRDVELPWRLMTLFELRGTLVQFSRQGAEARRVAEHLIFGVENSIKALRGMHEALGNPQLMAGKHKAEDELRARVASDPELAKLAGGAWDAIDGALAEYRQFFLRYQLLENGWRSSTLMRHAIGLHRALVERKKPDDKRLPEYTDARFPTLQAFLLSDAPVYDELETAVLQLLFTRLRDELGPDDPVVRELFAGRDPAAVAAEIVKATQVKDAAVRRKWLEGTPDAPPVEADPLLQWVSKMDVAARAVRARYEERVDAILQSSGEAIARARFSLYGTSIYPDATFTLRLSFGVVRGWKEKGEDVAPFTTFKGMFARHTGAVPFSLPARWLSARERLNLEMPLNFCATNDIIGGNSGSPVIDAQRRVVGLVFDGNIHSLGGEYAYIPDDNRMVAVDARAIVEALRNVYGFSRLLEELGQK